MSELTPEEREAVRAAYRGVPRVRMGRGSTFACFEEGWRAARTHDDEADLRNRLLLKTLNERDEELAEDAERITALEARCTKLEEALKGLIEELEWFEDITDEMLGRIRSALSTPEEEKA